MYLYQHKDFEDLIDQVARTRKMPFAFVEKDYWITYVLFRLTLAGANDFIFKGGTSLTKGWDLLERFSEDIDLLFVPSDLSKEQKRKRLKRIQELVLTFEGLEHDPDNSSSLGHYRIDSLKYKIKKSSTLGILLPYIKLEMGYRGGDAPASEMKIQSYVGKALTEAGQLLDIEDVSDFSIKILDSRRTFTEKIFAIYSAFEDSEIRKYFRHYYDVYKLLDREDVQLFIGTPEYAKLKEHVAEMSREFYSTKFPVDLDFSVAGAFVRTDNLVRELQRAIDAGKDLFFSEPPSAEEILERIEKFRSKL